MFERAGVDPGLLGEERVQEGVERSVPLDGQRR